MSEPILFFGGPMDGTIRAVEPRQTLVTVAEFDDPLWGDLDPSGALKVKYSHYYVQGFVIDGVTYRCWKHEGYPVEVILLQVKAVLLLIHLATGAGVSDGMTDQQFSLR